MWHRSRYAAKKVLWCRSCTKPCSTLCARNPQRPRTLCARRLPRAQLPKLLARKCASSFRLDGKSTARPGALILPGLVVAPAVDVSADETVLTRPWEAEVHGLEDLR